MYSPQCQAGLGQFAEDALGRTCGVFFLFVPFSLLSLSKLINTQTAVFVVLSTTGSLCSWGHDFANMDVMQSVSRSSKMEGKMKSNTTWYVGVDMGLGNPK